MNVRRWNAVVWVVLLAAVALTGACRKTYTYAVVPRPNGGYRAIDTLRATQNGNDVRVTFRFDTVTHTRTIFRTDTLWREGTRIIRDTVRLIRRDTVRVVRRDTVRLMRVDTVQVVAGGVVPVRVARPDTVVVTRTVARVDTVFVDRQTATQVRADTVRLVFRDTVVVTRPGRVDTVRRVDTVTALRQERGRIVDTVRIVRTDTVRLAGRRTLFVPPGQYPPAGQCRVWVHDRPPGQQRDAAPCDALGDIPAGAFILFGGEAWDADYDWTAEGAGRAPPQIVSLKKPGGRGRRPQG